MDSILSLWLPIVVSVAGCFVMSALIWMALPIHKADWNKLPNEDGVMDTLRAQSLKPGWYMFPFCDHKTMNEPAAKAKRERGPCGTITIFPAGMAMGRSLGIWAVHLLIVATAVAYVVGKLRGAGTDFMGIAKLAGAMSFLVFAGHELPGMAWKGQPAAIALRNLVDAAIYAVIFGAAFGGLWPAAAGS